MKADEQLNHLFKLEFSKIVAVISKRFGLQHIEIAEDIVSDTFLSATEAWHSKGVPENPTAWLYVVAKQKALYLFRRNKIYRSNVLPEVITTVAVDDSDDIDFSPQNINDSQLQMLFAICNPAIASEAQIGLALRILCGFGIDEIAEAFLTNKETINKRLFRAKDKLRAEKIQMQMPSEREIVSRLENVLRVIYLLFNEGYYSKTQNQILRHELCFEALRLGVMLVENDRTNLPKSNALVALMCFHASRFVARQSGDTNSVILYEQQDDSLWNITLINQGIHYLSSSAEGSEVSPYHLEARIAYWHCQKEDTPEKWLEILALYNDLLLMNDSPSVELNRIFALYKVSGRAVALTAAEKLGLESNHFYHLLLAELHENVDNDKCRHYLETALALAKTQTEKLGIHKKMAALP